MINAGVLGEKFKKARHSERSALARSEESKALCVCILDSRNVANANLWFGFYDLVY